jgi:ATP phosphoribosyltransferase
MSRIRLALQKSGRLSEDSFELLKQSGIKIRRYNGQLFCHSENFPIDILLVRDDDIPNLVIENVCDFGIVGLNVLQEKSLSLQSKSVEELVTPIQELKFGWCRLSLAVPNNFDYTDLSSLSGKSIASSYPFILKEYLKKNNVDAKIIELSGSIEIAPRLGIADVICDLVSTGGTLAANHLREVSTIFESQAVLIKSRKVLTAEQQKAADLLAKRIQGVLQANESKYIMLHAPIDKVKDIVELLPGAEYPTLINLGEGNNKIGVHAVCHERIFWETLEALKTIGASSILVVPVEKIMS